MVDPATLQRRTDDPDPTVTPLGDWVLLREREKRAVTHRIQLPDNVSNPRLAKWTVAAVGPDVKKKIKPGDHVVVQPAHVMVAPIAGHVHGLVQEHGLVAVVVGDDEVVAGKILSAEGFVE